MSRSAVALAVLTVIAFVFIGLGLANQREFQRAAILESEKQIKKTFRERGEGLSELGQGDYSLGRIKMMAKTKEAEYIVTLRVLYPEWITNTALNFFIAPTVAIQSVERRR